MKNNNSSRESNPGKTKSRSMPLRFFSSNDIHRLVSMEDAIMLMEKAFISVSAGKSHVPQRYIPEFKERNLKLLLKPAFSYDSDYCGVKVLAQKEKDPSLNLPTITGIMVLVDTSTGQILSVMEGSSITALRTGSASGIATKYLARDDARVAAIFGCGVQGRTQLEAISAVRNLEKVYVYDINPQTAEEYIELMQSRVKAELHFTDDLSRVSEADIICTATGAQAPLFKLEHLKPGVHLNAIGSFQPHMQEIDPWIIQSSRLFVEQKSSSFAESGDLIKPLREKIITEDHLVGEIGELFMGKKQGRISHTDTTLFKSVGIAIQDLVVAGEVYRKAENSSIGTTVEL
ncbi:MAG: hypothetical protein KGY60_04920 [Bacteroidales bacterium]|nr:hypothetical protein [Bacteroidales bacterium]